MVAGAAPRMIHPKKKPLLSRMRKYLGFYFLFAPVLGFLVVFHYLPMFGVSYAFTNYTLLGNDTSFVGLQNFINLFADPIKTPQFLKAFWNTLEYSVLKLLLNTFMAVLISLLLNEMTHLWFKKLAQTIIYLPHFMSWVVTASIFTMLFSASDSGLVNQVLVRLGILNAPVYYLADYKTWPIVYYIVNIWRDTGWQTIIFMATLTGIDPGIYEAASIDGAGRWKKMWYITMPSLANTIITVLILNLAKIMNLFESVFVLQNDAVRRYTHVLQTYVYQQTFAVTNPNYGYTTAVGLFRSMVGMALFLICNYASKKVRGRGIV